MSIFFKIKYGWKYNTIRLTSDLGVVFIPLQNFFMCQICTTDPTYYYLRNLYLHNLHPLWAYYWLLCFVPHEVASIDWFYIGFFSSILLNKHIFLCSTIILIYTYINLCISMSISSKASWFFICLIFILSLIFWSVFVSFSFDLHTPIHIVFSLIHIKWWVVFYLIILSVTYGISIDLFDFCTMK